MTLQFRSHPDSCEALAGAGYAPVRASSVASTADS